MTWLFALHGVIAAAAPAIARRWGMRRAFEAAAVAPAVTLLWATANAPSVLDGSVVRQRFSWVPGLGLDVTLRLDAFSLLMVGLIAGVGLLICIYSRSYFSENPALGRLAGLLIAFAGSMLGVVLADNVLVIYVFWELTSITSYLLIGYDDLRHESRSAALQAILVTGAGGLAMLAGFILLGQAAGTYALSEILADPPTGGTVGTALVLILLGAVTKSAQVPFHFWLPGAMAAPTPVSAYLHSATMVKAGVYLIARLAPTFADVWSPWRPVVITLGLVTMLVGGWQALRETDLKLLLAYGTVSQLGFMVVLVGGGHPELTVAGMAVLLSHGLFKAALFMVVGILDRTTGTRDLRRLDGLARRMPLLAVVGAVSVASMAGIIPFIGFLAKESAYEALLHPGEGVGTVVLAGVVMGSVLTVAYGCRFLWGAFAAKPATDLDGEVALPAHTPGAAFVGPAVLLALLTGVLGVVAALPSALVEPAAAVLDRGASGAKLALWHGFTTALGLSVLTVAAGLVLFAVRRPLERLQARRVLPRATAIYQAVVTRLLSTADDATAIAQTGSLPGYLTVITLTVLALPGVALLRGWETPSGAVLAESPLQLGVIGLTMAVAVTATVLRRRFAAVLCLGGVGFGVAVLFVLQGAPDLALTQLLVETLSVAIFVLVLRHLPERFGAIAWRAAHTARLAVAVGVGVFVAAFALMASSVRTAEPVSEAQVERALPDGGGANVVNVILVDIRGLDTLGEITVLTVAGLGIAGLVAAGRTKDNA